MTIKPLPPFPAAGGSYLLDEHEWEWVLQDNSESQTTPPVVVDESPSED